MFPLNSNSRNNIDPAAVSYYTDQSILHNNRPFLNDVIISPNNPNPNPSSKQEENYSHSLSPFFHFPSPNFIHHDLELLEDPETLHHLLQHHHHHHYDDHLLHTQQQQQQQQPPPPQKLSTNMMVVDSAAKEKISTTIPLQKRSSKRDRHSKINTAKGLRDRRMRLSLEVAKEFFGLQDMLGFDKGSKTVEWLLTQAKPEIKALAKTKGIEIQSFSASGNGAKTNSSTSDCEVVSGVDETTTRESTSNNSKEKCTPSNKGKKIRKCREIAIRPHARDLREKARERARERTREKMWRQKMDGPKLRCIIDEAINNSSNNSNSNNNSNEINQLSSWSSFETTGEESGTQSMQLHDEHLGGNYNQEGEGFREDSNMIVGTWSSSSTVLNYLPNMIIPQEQQFPDFRFVGKL